jgi:hypothetical protein
MGQKIKPSTTANTKEGWGMAGKNARQLQEDEEEMKRWEEEKKAKQIASSPNVRAPASPSHPSVNGGAAAATPGGVTMSGMSASNGPSSNTLQVPGGGGMMYPSPGHVGSVLGGGLTMGMEQPQRRKQMIKKKVEVVKVTKVEYARDGNIITTYEYIRDPHLIHLAKLDAKVNFPCFQPSVMWLVYVVLCLVSSIEWW